MGLKLMNIDKALIIRALHTELGMVENDIATCPDPDHYYEDILKLEQKIVHINRLLARLEANWELNE